MPENTDLDYKKYLSHDPTPLMVHAEKWIRDKTGIARKFKGMTPAEAFAFGVYLTVHLRMAHQGSPENQARLDANRKAAEALQAEAQARREVRLANGAKERGRMPKSLLEAAASAAKKAASGGRAPAKRAPAKRAPAKKTVEPAPVKAAPKARQAKKPTEPKPAPAKTRQTKPRVKAAAKSAPAPTPEPQVSAPAVKRRRRPAAPKPTVAEVPPSNVTSIEERRASTAVAGTQPRRRRSAARVATPSGPKDGEAAF